MIWCHVEWHGSILHLVHPPSGEDTVFFCYIELMKFTRLRIPLNKQFLSNIFVFRSILNRNSTNILINIFCINFELLGNWLINEEFSLPHSMKHGLIRWHASVVGMMWCRSMMIQMIQRMRRRMVRMMRMMRVRIMIYSMVIRATNSIPISHYDHHFETKHTFWIITFVNSSNNNYEEKYQHL